MKACVDKLHARTHWNPTVQASIYACAQLYHQGSLNDVAVKPQPSSQGRDVGRNSNDRRPTSKVFTIDAYVKSLSKRFLRIAD